MAGTTVHEQWLDGRQPRPPTISATGSATAATAATTASSSTPPIPSAASTSSSPATPTPPPPPRKPAPATPSATSPTTAPTNIGGTSGAGSCATTAAAEDVILHRYNGLGMRIATLTDTDASGVLDGDDDWRYFAYTESWQQVATLLEGDPESGPEEVFVHHAAGIGGSGSSSYIDNVLLRDRGSERTYYCHNWRNDISVLLSQAGNLVEWVKYSAYGEPFNLPPGDPDSDGDMDFNEYQTAFGGGYDVRLDIDLSGALNVSDFTAFLQAYALGAQGGPGVLSRGTVQNRRGYAGYEYEPAMEGSGRTFYQVRHRWYEAGVGRWMSRDPEHYQDSANLYEYVLSTPLGYIDTYGLSIASCYGDNCDLPGLTPPRTHPHVPRHRSPEEIPQGCPLQIDMPNSTDRSMYCDIWADGAFSGKVGTPECLAAGIWAARKCCNSTSSMWPSDCFNKGMEVLTNCNQKAFGAHCMECFPRCMDGKAGDCFWFTLEACGLSGVMSKVKAFCVVDCLMTRTRGTIYTPGWQRPDLIHCLKRCGVTPKRIEQLIPTLRRPRVKPMRGLATPRCLPAAYATCILAHGFVCGRGCGCF